MLFFGFWPSWLTFSFLFPFSFFVFIDYFLLTKKSFNSFLFSFFFQFFLIFSLGFFYGSFNFDFFFLIFSFFSFFWFLFYFLEFFSSFIFFDFIFEFSFILTYFLFLSFLSFFYCTFSFDLNFAVLGLVLFSFFRIFYLFFKIFLRYHLANRFSSFLSRWTYVWFCSLLNLFSTFLLFYFWNFDLYLIFSFLNFQFSFFFFLLLGLFFFPYFILFSDFLVEAIFSRIFSISSGYSARAQTFKVSINWILRISFGIIYSFFWFSSMSINVSTISWNLSLVLAFGSLGFKGVIDDFINGICVLVEDSVNLGEFIQVAGVSGTVEDVTLRVIKLRNFDGSLFIVPFRKVEIIRNRSKDFVFIVFDISVDPSFHSSFILDWIQSAFSLFKASKNFSSFSSYILNDLEIIGISSVTSAGIIYQSRLKIIPFNTRLIKGSYLLFLKDLALERSIKFGFHYSVIHP